MDFVVFSANCCISQDLAQDREAPTCCLTALPVGRRFAQYGQRWDIFWRCLELEGEFRSQDSQFRLRTSPPARANATQVALSPLLFFFCSLVKATCAASNLLRQMHSFQSTIRTQTADVLFTRPTLFIVCGVGVYKWVSLPISLQAPVLTTY